jgi:hypothetical protein
MIFSSSDSEIKSTVDRFWWWNPGKEFISRVLSEIIPPVLRDCARLSEHISKKHG